MLKYNEIKAKFIGNEEQFIEFAYKNDINYLIEEKEGCKYIYFYDLNLNKFKLNDFIDYNSIEKHIVEYEQYIKEYYKHYKPIKIGLFNIIPYFYEYEQSRFNIILDPGYCFGTGLHETTQLILKIMSKLNLKNKDVLDIGTGSGILSIAASKLNANLIIGIDIDKCILYSCNKNKELNNINDIIFINGDIDTIKHNIKFDYILINMIPNNFKNFFKKIHTFLKNNGKIILTGFLSKQKAEIIDYVSYNKYKIKGEEQLNDWHLFLLEYNS